MSHACDTCDPAVGVSESNPAPGVYVFTCCGCGRELWQEHEPKPDAYADLAEVDADEWREGRP